jgi:serine/threonine protein phosphatase 1
VVGFFLEGTRIEYEDEYAYYLHAGAKPQQPVWRTSGLIKMWGTRDFLTSTYDWGKPVVFGHWKMPQPLLAPNKIGIDTGAYESGILSAVRLPDRQIFQALR